MRLLNAPPSTKRRLDEVRAADRFGERLNMLVVVLFAIAWLLVPLQGEGGTSTHAKGSHIYLNFVAGRTVDA